MNEFLSYNKLGSVTRDTAPVYTGEMKKTELKSPSPTRVPEVNSQSTQISLKKEETPLKHQTDFEVRVSEVMEKTEKVEEKLNKSEDVIERFKKAAAEKAPEKKEVQKQEFIQKFDTYKKEAEKIHIETSGKPKEYHHEADDLFDSSKYTKVSFEDSEKSKEHHHKADDLFAASEYAKENFKKEKLSRKKTEFAEKDTHSHPKTEKDESHDVAAKQNEISAEDTRAANIKEKEDAKNAAAIEENTELKKNDEAPPTTDENPSKVTKKSNHEKNVSLGDLVESLRLNLQNQEDSTPTTPLPALTRVEFDLEKVDDLSHKVNQQSHELANVIAQTPASSLESEVSGKLLNYFDKTLQDIQETRSSLKEMKAYYEHSLKNNTKASTPQIQVKKVERFEEVKKILEEITDGIPAQNFRKAQQRITPEAVSQLIF
ncbi:hypothetical protein K1X76_02690 [bacterium]|nr:hypothetical protein [bacterium]